ncbi:hypothetical protein AB3X49_22410, partial [Bacillus sp. C30]
MVLYLRINQQEAFKEAGDEEKGQNQFSKLLPYMHSIIEMGTIRTIKYLLEKRNIQVEICREPLSTLSIE